MLYLKNFLKTSLFLFFVFLPSLAMAERGYKETYNALLHDHVYTGDKAGIKANLVDYDAWAKDPRHGQAMKALVGVDVSTLNHQALKVFWINAYNLLTIDLIVKNSGVKSIKDLGTLLQSPWKAHSWQIAGKAYTLDQIEHDILRKMHDPRIHMAIVCASLSCPDLRNEIYTEKALNSQLDDQARKFLSNPTKGLNKNSSGLTLSPIFKWFAEDFGGEKGVLEFVRKYSSTISGDATMDGYFSYDWNLNKP
jgi:hypothetical protein